VAHKCLGRRLLSIYRSCVGRSALRSQWCRTCACADPPLCSDVACGPLAGAAWGSLPYRAMMDLLRIKSKEKYSPKRLMGPGPTPLHTRLNRQCAAAWCHSAPVSLCGSPSPSLTSHLSPLSLSLSPPLFFSVSHFISLFCLGRCLCVCLCICLLASACASACASASASVSACLCLCLCLCLCRWPCLRLCLCLCRCLGVCLCRSLCLCLCPRLGRALGAEA
jgi:hypothetical protein